MFTKYAQRKGGYIRAKHKSGYAGVKQKGGYVIALAAKLFHGLF